MCLIAGPSCVLLAMGAARPPASPSPVRVLRMLSTLVPTATCRHLSESISHGLSDSLGQSGDIRGAQALGFHLGEDLDGARPWIEKGKTRDAVR